MTRERPVMVELDDDIVDARTTLLSPETRATLERHERLRKEKLVQRAERREEIKNNTLFVILVLAVNWIIWLVTGFLYYVFIPNAGPGDHVAPDHWAFLFRENWLMFQVCANLVWILFVSITEKK